MGFNYTNLNFKKLLDFKFTFICLVYFFVIVFLATKPVSKPALLNIVSFVFVFHLCSRIKYTIIPALLLAIPLSFDAFFAFVYRTQINIGNIASFIETNSQEFKGVMGQLWLPATAIFLFTLAIVYLSIREFKQLKITAKISFVALFTYLLIFIPLITYRKAKVNTLDNVFWQQPAAMFQYIIAKHTPLFYNGIICCVAYNEEMDKMTAYNEDERALPEGIELDKNSETPEKIYVVFGESAYRKHFSLYGYDIKTTPFLDSMAVEDSSQLNYYAGISPANLTRNSVRLCLTFSTPQDINAFYSQKSIIDMANDAGYETIWLTNQSSKISISNSYTTALMNEANRAIPSGSHGDMALVKLLRENKTPGKKQFILMHQDGSHIPYIPPRYDSIDAEAIKDQSEVSLYDRTIHHTDRFLREVLKIASEDPSAVIYYVSDHGETVNQSHGFLLRGTDQFEVPLLTINQSMLNVDSIARKYVNPETGYLNGLSTIYILSEILGYKVSDDVVKYAIESGKYVYQANGKAYLYKDIENNNVDY